MKKFHSIILSVVIMILMSGCAFSSKPSNSKIISDLYQLEAICSASNLDFCGTGFDIDSIEIELGDKSGDIWSGELLVKQSNEIYDANRECSVTYKHYDKGGWVLEDADISESVTITKVLDIPGEYEVAEKCGINDYDFKKTKNKKITKDGLYSSTVDYVFEAAIEGSCIDCSYKETVSLITDENGWKLDGESKIEDIDYSINTDSGIWFYTPNGNDGYALHVCSANDDTVEMDVLVHDFGSYFPGTGRPESFERKQEVYYIEDVSIKKTRDFNRLKSQCIVTLDGIFDIKIHSDSIYINGSDEKISDNNCRWWIKEKFSEEYNEWVK